MINIASYEITTNDDPYLGISFSIFCAGCNKRCKGCHSPDLQNPNSGKMITEDVVFDLIRRRMELVDSVVFIGGEWMLQQEGLKYLAEKIKNLFPNKKTILYTGDTFETISDNILKVIDIIIDGEYVEELKTKYKIPASSNQKVFVKMYQKDLFNNTDLESYHMQVNPKDLPINKEN